MRKAILFSVIFTAFCMMFASCGGDSSGDSDPIETPDVTVTFDPQNGECSTLKHDYYSSFPCGWLPKAKSNLTDYVFCGWNLVADGSGKTIGKNYVFKKDITVYAQYTYVDPYIRCNLYYNHPSASGVTLTNTPADVGYLKKGDSEIVIAPLPTYIETSTKDFIGYFLADGITRVADVNGDLLPNIDGITSAEGYWISNTAVDLYAHWKDKDFITSIRMDSATYTRQVGQILEISCTYTPANATDYITWTCANANLQYLTSECANGVAKAKYALNGMSLSGSIITAKSTQHGILASSTVYVNMGSGNFTPAKMASVASYDIDDWNLGEVSNDCVVYQLDLVNGKKYQVLWCDDESGNANSRQMFTDAGKTLGDCYISIYDAQGNSNVFRDLGDFVFTAKTTGKHYIILRSDNPSSVLKACGFSIYPLAEITSLSMPSSLTTVIGSEENIVATYEPATAVDVVKWTTSSSYEALVEENTGTNGTANYKFNANLPSVFAITATSKADENIKKNCNVTVKFPEDTDIPVIAVDTAASTDINDWTRIEMPDGRAKVYRTSLVAGEYYTIETSGYNADYSILGAEASYQKSECYVYGYESRTSNTINFSKSYSSSNSSYTFKSTKTGDFYFVISKADYYTTDGLYAVHLFHERKITDITLSSTSLTKTLGDTFTITANFNDPLCNKGITWRGDYNYNYCNRLISSTNGVENNVGTGTAIANCRAEIPGTSTVRAYSNQDSTIYANCSVRVNMPDDSDIPEVAIGNGPASDISQWTIVDMPGGISKVYKMYLTYGKTYYLSYAGYGQNSILGEYNRSKRYCRIYQYRSRTSSYYTSSYVNSSDGSMIISPSSTGYYYIVIAKETSYTTDGQAAFYIFEQKTPTAIAYEESSLDVNLNDDFTLKANNIPSDSFYKIYCEWSDNYIGDIYKYNLLYRKSNTSDVTTGPATSTFRALVPGTYSIRSYSGYNSSLEDYCTVKVAMPDDDSIPELNVDNGPGSLPDWQIVQMPGGKSVVYKASLTAGQTYSIEYAGYSSSTSVLGPEANSTKSACYVSGFASRDQALCDWMVGYSSANGIKSFTPITSGTYYFVISRPYDYYSYDGLWAIHLYRQKKLTSISLPSTYTAKVGEDFDLTATFTDPESTIGLNWGPNYYSYSIYRLSATTGVDSGAGTGSATATYKTYRVGSSTVTVSSNEDNNVNAQCVVNVVLPDDSDIPDVPVKTGASSDLSDWQVVNMNGGRSKVYKAYLTADHTYNMQYSGYSSSNSILGSNASWSYIDVYSNRTNLYYTQSYSQSDGTRIFTPSTTGYYYFVVRHESSSTTSNVTHAFRLYE